MLAVSDGGVLPTGATLSFEHKLDLCARFGAVGRKEPDPDLVVNEKAALYPEAVEQAVTGRP
jgi:hypothetical protein